MFFDEKLLKSSDFYYFEPSLYPSIKNTVEAMKSLIQEICIHSESSIAVQKSRRTLKDKIYVPKEVSGLAVFNRDLGLFLAEEIMAKEFGVMLGGEGRYKPGFAHDIVRL